MKREQYSEMAARASRYAYQYPGRYEWKVMLWAILGYVMIYGSILGCMVAIYITGTWIAKPWLFHLLLRDPRLWIVVSALIFFVSSLLFSLVKALFIQWPEPVGRRITKEDAPRLFAMIDDLLALGAAKKPTAVLLTVEYNACVVQMPRWGWLGTRDYLQLGIPLMTSLTPDEFRAILAHEFAHLRKNHGRSGGRIYRVRAMWGQFLDRLNVGTYVLGQFLMKFIRWYAPRFHAYTAALSRKQELESDAWAGKKAGNTSIATALIKLSIGEKRLNEDFWEPLFRMTHRLEKPPSGIFSQLIGLLREPANDERVTNWLRDQLALQTQPGDSHPCLQERVSALGFHTEMGDTGWGQKWLNNTNDTERAWDLLPPDSQTQLLKELETNWSLSNQSTWQRSFEQGRKIRERLRDIEGEINLAGGSATVGQDWERVTLEILLEEKDGVEAKFRTFIEKWPQHAPGQFTLGRLLLEKNIPQGFHNLEAATLLDARLAAEAHQLCADYWRRQGQLEEAEEHQKEVYIQADILDEAALERLQATQKHTYLPAELEESRLTRLRDELAQHPAVVQAWVVRKNVTHFPENPCFVIVCQVRFARFQFSSQKKLNSLFFELCHSISLIKDGALLFIGKKSQLRSGVVKKIRKVAGLPFYPYPAPVRGTWWKWWQKKEIHVPEKQIACLSRTDPPTISPPLILQEFSQMQIPHRVTISMALVVASLAVALPLGLAGWQVAPLFRRSLHSGGGKEAGLPIIMVPGASLSEASRQSARKWANRLFLTEGYDKTGSHNPRWDALARSFIEQSIPWWAGTNDAPTQQSLQPLMQTLLDLECDDPAFLYFAGRLSSKLNYQDAQAGVLLQKAITGFNQSGYLSAAGRLTAEAFVQDCSFRREGTGQRKSGIRFWELWFRQSLYDGSYSTGEQSVLAYHFANDKAARYLLDTQASTCLNMLADADRGPTSFWVRQYLAGECHINLAFQARGEGYASEVPKDNWRAFQHHLDLARDFLTASWKNNPHRPEAAAAMIQVTMGENNRFEDTERVWFDRAIAAEFDFFPAYRRYRNSLRSCWGGSAKQLLSFGKQCAATLRYDTAIPLYLFRAQMTVADENGDRTDIFRDSSQSAALENMFDGYEKTSLSRTQTIFYRAMHGRAAEYLPDHSKAYALFNSIDFQLPDEVIETLDDDDKPDSFIQRVCAFGGPGNAEITAGEAALRNGNRQLARDFFLVAQRTAEKNPQGQAYAQNKLATLLQEEKLATGDWISFLPPANFAGWTIKLGTWKMEPDGTLLSRTGGQGALLVSNTPIGPDFEVTGEMDFSAKDQGELQSGVAFGYPDFDRTDWRSMRIKRFGTEGSIATIAQHWHDGPTVNTPVQLHNTFQLRSWQRRLTLVINGETVFNETLLRDGEVKDAGSLVALGAYAHEGNSFEVRYRNIKLRRLLPKH